MKTTAIAIVFLFMCINAKAEDGKFTIDPKFSYELSRDGGFFRWGDGHRYNGESEEARKIWRDTFYYLGMAAMGMVWTGVGIYNSTTDGGKVFMALGGSVGMVGIINYTVQRNRDISTAPTHAVSINLKFGGVSESDYHK